MYIAKVCRNWVDLPFWKSSFKLTTSKDLKFLQSCGVRCAGCLDRYRQR
ncbi:MAG: hypothetical protein ACI9KN_001247, partial [Gammaproteobacteria bacterium]